MLHALARILVFQALGDLVCAAFSLPLPGAAVGLALAFGWFLARGGPDAETGRLFDGVVGHLPLLFVPAAVGVVARPDLVAGGWLPVLVAVVAGTVVTLALTALAGAALIRWLAPAPEPAPRGRTV
ncbi:MAG: CidA/LrgA family protein [Paracoccaceae bacterium]